jgi:aerobic-type carbon monoxide dehydrogenase small subunit (CoxS/CutS family)
LYNARLYWCICQIHQQWEQRDKYSLGSLYNARLLSYSSNTPAVGTRLKTNANSDVLASCLLNGDASNAEVTTWESLKERPCKMTCTRRWYYSCGVNRGQCWHRQCYVTSLPTSSLKEVRRTVGRCGPARPTHLCDLQGTKTFCTGSETGACTVQLTATHRPYTATWLNNSGA